MILHVEDNELVVSYVRRMLESKVGKLRRAWTAS